MSVDINRSHFCVEVMEIKTVSTGPCWESHLHRLAFHLHGHRHGHLHQVPLKLHYNLRQNYMYMLGNKYWIYSWRDIFEMGKKPILEKKHIPFPVLLFVSTRSPTPLNYEETHVRRCFHIESQKSLIYYEHVLAKLSHRHFFISFSFFWNRNDGGVQCS